jgi:hypothetical protein
MMASGEPAGGRQAAPWTSARTAAGLAIHTDEGLVLPLTSNRQFDGYDTIRELARARSLIMIAYEGVLVDPPPASGAGLDERMRALLRAAAVLYPCAVVTSGEPSSVAAQLERVPSLAVLTDRAASRARAVEQFAAGFPPWPISYIGSTADDEPVFRSKVVTHPIRVGAAAGTAARYFVNDRTELGRFLSQLVSERTGIAGLGATWQQLDRERTW